MQAPKKNAQLNEPAGGCVHETQRFDQDDPVGRCGASRVRSCLLFIEEL
jgi:hypothetical protein